MSNGAPDLQDGAPFSRLEVGITSSAPGSASATAATVRPAPAGPDAGAPS